MRYGTGSAWVRQSYDRILVTSEVRRQFEFVLLQPRFRQYKSRGQSVPLNRL
jgi:hypothetical protein